MVFTTAVRQGYTWLVVIGVLNTAISAYYYLRLIVVMFFRERNAPWDPPRIPVSIAVALVLPLPGSSISGFSGACHQGLWGPAHHFNPIRYRH